jgi:hypothetical protein
MRNAALIATKNYFRKLGWFLSTINARTVATDLVLITAILLLVGKLVGFEDH